MHLVTPSPSSFFVYTIWAHLSGAVCPSVRLRIHLSVSVTRLDLITSDGWVRMHGCASSRDLSTVRVWSCAVQSCQTEPVIVNYVLASVMSPARDVRI